MAVSINPMPIMKNWVNAMGAASLTSDRLSVMNRLMDENVFPEEFFRRADESPDGNFYLAPRFVAHIDPGTIEALTRFYREFVPLKADVLDLMSSWISHLPMDLTLGRVAGLGMNEEELADNARLTEYVVHDLNRDHELPYAPESFDRVLISVSIQYLVKPVHVLSSACSVIRPGGQIAIAMSHRCFPTKAIAAFHSLPPKERVELVSTFLSEAGFEGIRYADRSPPAGDPLWILIGAAPSESTR